MDGGLSVSVSEAKDLKHKMEQGTVSLWVRSSDINPASLLLSQQD